MSAITSRATNLVWELPKACIYTGRDSIRTIIGVAATALSIVTAGQVKTINAYADWVGYTHKILPDLFLATLRVINPDAKVGHTGSVGIISDRIECPIFKKAQSASKSESWIERHIVSRGAYALDAIVTIITKIADLIIGLCALPVAIVTFGGYVQINTFVADQLEFFRVVEDICNDMRGFVNPQQFNR